MTIIFGVFLFLISYFLLFTRTKKQSERVPPGSLGLPVIGQSISFLRAMRANTAEKWLQQRIQKYGPVSKLSLFGTPTVFIHGQAANKFIYTTDGSSSISNQQPDSTRRILGERNILELSVEDHKRVRKALMTFLKPESLRRYVGKMDEIVKKHLEMHWHGKQQVTVLPLMKSLTFSIISSLLFGVEQGTQQDELVECFKTMMKGMISLPISLPFTAYNRGLKASKRVHDVLVEVLCKKRVQLEQKIISPQHDLITCFLSIRNEDSKEEFTEIEIMHNVRMIMAAGHDTLSTSITCLLRVLANEPAICAAVLQEQEEISRSKLPGELLTWEDLTKMKYTWRVAQETLRTTPPVLCNFRKAMKDLEIDGFLIPKGWQILWATPMTQLDDNIFPEPSKFDPSRFDNEASKSSVPPYCFIPFGAGPRICPGYEFAKIEILITVHYLVTRFKWKRCADNHFSRDPMPVPTKGLPIEITPRAPL